MELGNNKILVNTMDDMVKLISMVDQEKNVALVLFNSMMKNDFYLEGIKPEYRNMASFFKEEKDALNICKVTAVALKNYKDLQIRENSKKVAMMVLDKIDSLDVLE